MTPATHHRTSAHVTLRTVSADSTAAAISGYFREHPSHGVGGQYALMSARDLPPHLGTRHPPEHLTASRKSTTDDLNHISDVPSP